MIWRRIQVDANTLLTDLHKIIQSSMGWTNSHLHQFKKSGILFALPSEDDFEEPEIIDYRGIRICALLRDLKDRIIYEYDFGDCWEHDIVLESEKAAGALMRATG